MALNNNSIDNLAWLCFRHHSIYDSNTSQHKNYKISEVKYYRNQLHEFLSTNPNIDLSKSPISKLNKPYVLLFDGVNDYAVYEGKELQDLTEFIVEGEFRIGNTTQGGSIIAINDEFNNSIAYLRYNSIDDEKYPGEAILIIEEPNSFRHNVRTGCLVSNLEWINFRIIYKDNTWTVSINDQRVFCNDVLKANIRSVQIGSAQGVGNYGKQFLSCYFTKFSLYDISHEKLLFNFIFEFGKEYFRSLPKSESLKFVNMIVDHQFTFYKGLE